MCVCDRGWGWRFHFVLLADRITVPVCWLCLFLSCLLWISVGDKISASFGFGLHCEFASNWHHPHLSLKSTFSVYKARRIKPDYWSEILNSWQNSIAVIVSGKNFSCRDKVGTKDLWALLASCSLDSPFSQPLKDVA